MSSITSPVSTAHRGVLPPICRYGEEKWRLFQTSDFFVLPTHSENFGLAIAESLASGTPVITTTGTPWSDLNTSHAGAWIEVGTAPLVETLRRFLALTDDEREAMGRNGRRLIEEKYSAKVMAEEMMEVYKGVSHRFAQIFSGQHQIARVQARIIKKKSV